LRSRHDPAEIRTTRTTTYQTLTPKTTPIPKVLNLNLTPKAKIAKLRAEPKISGTADRKGTPYATKSVAFK